MMTVTVRIQKIAVNSSVKFEAIYIKSCDFCTLSARSAPLILSSFKNHRASRELYPSSFVKQIRAILLMKKYQSANICLRRRRQSLKLVLWNGCIAAQAMLIHRFPSLIRRQIPTWSHLATAHQVSKETIKIEGYIFADDDTERLLVHQRTTMAMFRIKITVDRTKAQRSCKPT